jgi:hypothetical protein
VLGHLLLAVAKHPKVGLRIADVEDEQHRVPEP